MVENKIWCHGENVDSKSDCILYFVFYLSLSSLFGLSFNLYSFRISFLYRRFPLAFPTLLQCFPQAGM